jgi:hypothetical protein
MLLSRPVVAALLELRPRVPADERLDEEPREVVLREEELREDELRVEELRLEVERDEVPRLPLLRPLEPLPELRRCVAISSFPFAA